MLDIKQKKHLLYQYVINPSCSITLLCCNIRIVGNTYEFDF